MKTTRIFWGLLLVTVSFVGFTACQKERSMEQPGTSPVSGSVFTGFVYDQERFQLQFHPSGKVKRVELVSDLFTQGDLVNYDVTYDATQRITQLTGSDGTIILVRYNTAGLMDRTETRLPDNQLISTTTFGYSQGRISQSTIQYVWNGIPVNFLQFAFTYDAAGNPVRIQTKGYDPVTQSWMDADETILTYDSRMNPLRDHRQLLQIFWQMPGQSNIIKEVHRDSEGHLVETVHYTYTYRADGLPASATIRVEPVGQTPETRSLQFQYR